jgi:hypothetical protein
LVWTKELTVSVSISADCKSLFGVFAIFNITFGVYASQKLKNLFQSASQALPKQKKL